MAIETVEVKTTDYTRYISKLSCDECGKTKNIKNSLVLASEFICSSIAGFTNILITPGYGSKFDEQEFSVVLCDDCLEKFLKKTNVFYES